MTRRVLVILPLLLASCVSTPQSSYTPPMIAQAAYKLSAPENAVIEEGVRKSLKDPNSAIFGTRFASKASSGEVYVCGYINARNSFGGYVGDQIFYGMLVTTDGQPKAFATLDIASTDIETTIARQMCASWAIFI